MLSVNRQYRSDKEEGGGLTQVSGILVSECRHHRGISKFLADTVTSAGLVRGLYKGKLRCSIAELE